MTDGLSAADVALLSGRNNGMFGGDGIGILALFFLFSMMGWGGYGGFGGFGNGFGERVATVGDVQRGFDTQTIVGKLDGINNGLCDGFYAQNTTMLQGFNGVQRDMCTGFSNTNAAINQARFENQQCCCDTQKEIIQNRYEAAQNTGAIIQATEKSAQRIIDWMCGQENRNLRDENMRNFIASQFCGVVRYPNQTTYTAGYSPCFSGYGNCGNCCGNGNI